jgi:flagellar biogenesis protein FliO
VGLRRVLQAGGMVGSQKVVRVVDRVVLDAKRAVFVLRAADEYLLVGGGEGSLTLLAKLDAATVEKSLEGKGPGAPGASPSVFQKLLTRRPPT